MDNIHHLMVAHRQMESERILLRPVSLDDAEEMYEHTSDEETTRYIYEQHIDLNQTKKLIENYFLKEPIGKYAIVLKETSKMIGTIEFRVHEWNKSGELGYILSRHYWGNGYMNESANLILGLAFNLLGLERVFSESDVKNEASSRMMSRLGMKYEGTLRRSHMVKGVLTDSVHYSILREEYEKSESI